LKHAHILLVEDNPDDEALTLLAFSKLVTNPIAVVRDGEEALEYLFQSGRYVARPDLQIPRLVLLDLKLPKVDGLEVLRRMRADPRTRLLPVVILSSSQEEQDVVSGYSLGANSYVRKPVDFQEFAEAAERMGMYWLLLNQDPLMRGSQ
jgi:two-component system response regulator